ncbi:hypothetical protein HAX54_030863, partial [Datura stramonium]|nr:hypothetical protein [Datura stramonium]
MIQSEWSSFLEERGCGIEVFTTTSDPPQSNQDALEVSTTTSYPPKSTQDALEVTIHPAASKIFPE